MPAKEAALILQQAADAVIESCDVQLGLRFGADGQPCALDTERPLVTSQVPFTRPTAGWHLAVSADESTAHTFTRLLFGMEPEEDVHLEDVADAIGELVNIAAGMLRARRLEAGDEVQMGLPLFTRGSVPLTMLPRGVHTLTQRISNPAGLQFQVSIICCAPTSED